MFNFRYSTEQTAQSLMTQVARLLEQHDFEYSLDWEISGAPFQTATPVLIDAVRESVRKVQSFEPELSTGGGTSDGRFIAALGTEIVELGPVNATIHSVDEHVRVDDLIALTDIYLGILEKLLNRDA